MPQETNETEREDAIRILKNLGEIPSRHDGIQAVDQVTGATGKSLELVHGLEDKGLVHFAPKVSHGMKYDPKGRWKEGPAGS
ncbi:MAG: hypothetical protein ABSH05_15760 [Bryobacteraceae bacterium]|jgi:hypothetical protein